MREVVELHGEAENVEVQRGVVRICAREDG